MCTDCILISSRLGISGFLNQATFRWLRSLMAEGLFLVVSAEGFRLICQTLTMLHKYPVDSQLWFKRDEELGRWRWVNNVPRSFCAFRGSLGCVKLCKGEGGPTVTSPRLRLLPKFSYQPILDNITKKPHETTNLACTNETVEYKEIKTSCT